MLKYLFRILFFAALLQRGFCFAQPVASPDLKCLAVATNGDVTLTWVTPSGPGGFIDYKIFSSTVQSGPYTLVATINTYAQTSYTHVGANANTNRIYYLIQTDYNPGPIIAAPKDTFSTVHLVVTNPGTGTAILNWNKISLQTIPTSTGWYKIYREYPAGIWTLRDSTKNLLYNDIIDICNDSLHYRIEISDNTGCTSVSNIGGGKFKDLTPPTISPIDTVSVNYTISPGRATISWTASPSKDADSIIIYKGPTINGAWFRIAAVKAPTTFYQYNLSKADSISENYSIAFKDSCGNISPIGTAHKTIFLSATFDICASTASLQWNKYVNWAVPVSKYEIWKSVNLAPYTLVANTIPSDTDYVDNGLTLGTDYCYIIRATNGTKTSSSNKVCFTPNVTQPPLYTYNRFATVISEHAILVKAHVDQAQSVKYYTLEKATAGGSFTLIPAATQIAVGGTVTYTDKAVTASAYSYIYRWNAMDSCAHVIVRSNPDTTMLLTTAIAPNLGITLTWNSYGDFLANVKRYDIYRSVDGVWNLSPITSVTPTGSTETYVDDVSAFFSTSKGIFAYYVVAIEGIGNTFSFKDTSVSNISSVFEYPKYYVPNAFTPNGDNTNDVFIPIIGFIEASDYSMTIFDNTGTPCFETHDPLEGWDGKKKGHNCMENVYMYLIQCKASNGDDSKIYGTLTLFR